MKLKFSKSNAIFVSIVIISVYAINFFIPKNLALISGEDGFSFSYLGHMKSIFYYLGDNPENWINVSTCENCPHFYQYSRWYSLWMFGLLGVGQILKIHPYLYYLFVAVVLQGYALYNLSKLIIRDTPRAIMILSILISITLPVKYVQLGSWEYPLVFSLFVASLTSLYRLFSLDDKSSTKSLIWAGLQLGLLNSFWLNIGINHLPIYIYVVLIILLLNIRIIFKKYLNLLLVFSVSAVIVFLVNLPFVVSVITLGNNRSFSQFLTLSFLESISARYYISGFSNLNNTILGLVFISYVTLLVVSKISLRKKLTSMVLYICVSILMFSKLIYGSIFYYLPLFSSMRASFRMNILSQIVLFTILFTGLFSVKKKNNVLFYIISIFLLCSNIAFIIKNSEFVNTFILPREYFVVSEFEKNDNKKIYFPLSQNIIGKYFWSSSPSIYWSEYKNPFTNILSVRNIVSPTFYWRQDPQADLFYKIENASDSAQVVKILSEYSIQDVIFDDNFNWDACDECQPYRSVGSLLEQKFTSGGLSVYSVPQEDSCLSGIGTFRDGYCQQKSQSSINAFLESHDELLLDDKRNIKKYGMDITGRENIYKYISDPQLKPYFEKRPLNLENYYSIKITDKKFSKIFSVDKPSGKYILLLTYLSTPKSTGFFGNSTVNINIDGVTLKSISPYSDKVGSVTISQEIYLPKQGEISIEVNGNKLLFLKKPILIDSVEYDNQIVVLRDKYVLISNLNETICKNKNNSSIQIRNTKFGDEYLTSAIDGRYLEVSLFEKNIFELNSFNSFKTNLQDEKYLLHTDYPGKYMLNFTAEFENTTGVTMTVKPYFVDGERKLFVVVSGLCSDNEYKKSYTAESDTDVYQVLIDKNQINKCTKYSFTAGILDSDSENLSAGLYDISLIANTCE